MTFNSIECGAHDLAIEALPSALLSEGPLNGIYLGDGRAAGDSCMASIIEGA